MSQFSLPLSLFHHQRHLAERNIHVCGSLSPANAIGVISSLILIEGMMLGFVSDQGGQLRLQVVCYFEIKIND